MQIVGRVSVLISRTDVVGADASARGVANVQGDAAQRRVAGRVHDSLVAALGDHAPGGPRAETDPSAVTSHRPRFAVFARTRNVNDCLPRSLRDFAGAATRRGTRR